MRNQISNIVNNVVSNYGTRNPFRICEKMGIKVKFVSYGRAAILNSELIFINENYDEQSKFLLCAHELGHAILHHNDLCNHYDENSTLEKIKKDEEANLFTAYLLLNESELDMNFSSMNSYLLQNLIEDHLNII